MSKGMARSKIGYTGIGSDSQPVDWYYGWNVGGFGCSNLANCPGCWSEAMCHRSACPDCAGFKVHVHPERLGQPAATKKPGVVLCNFTNDWLDKKRELADIGRIFEAMQDATQHVYVTLTKQPHRMGAIVDVCDGRAEPNHLHGVTIRQQADFDLRGDYFGGISWVSFEPLWREVNISEASKSPFRFGMDEITGVIVGQDRNRGAPGTDTLDHVRSVVKQCQAAGISVYVKQVFIGDKLRTDPADFPPDLRLRNLPWSMPK